MCDYLNARDIRGVRFIARDFRPTASLYKDQDCRGLEILLTERDALNSVAMGIEPYPVSPARVSMRTRPAQPSTSSRSPS